MSINIKSSLLLNALRIPVSVACTVSTLNTGVLLVTQNTNVIYTLKYGTQPTDYDGMGSTNTCI
jgi:hypothetical protein